MNKSLSLVAALLIVLFSCTRKNEVTIVKNGQSHYEIKLPENAEATLEKAAGELQKYLLQISSAKLPITSGENADTEKPVIRIQNDTHLAPHTISYFFEGKNLVLSGADEQSTLYAVYAFLENELACQWFSPAVEKVPTAYTLSVPKGLNYIYTPNITTRTVHSRLFYENPDFADKLKVSHDAFPNYVPVARVHTFHRLVPGEKFFHSHPEYFALRDGIRKQTQLCLSNKEVLNMVIDSVRTWFERYPDQQVVSVSQDDNTQYCQCEACSQTDAEEGSPSGSMIRFVNAVAKEFPDKTISTLAYQHTRKPCKTKPLDNVLITLCSIECDRSAPIEEKCTDFAEDLVGWKALTENIRIWDYTTQFTNFLAPFPNIMTLQPNIRFFRDNNATWIFEQHSHNPSELFELRSWLTAKLLWNPDLETDELITEFTNGYYEEAGPFVEKYVKRIHEELAKQPDFFLYLYGDPAQAFTSFLKPELLQEYNTLFDQAEEAVASKPEVLKRVRAARISTDYASLEMARNGMSEKFRLLDDGQISQALSQHLQRFEQSCRDENIALMNEMGYTVDEYLGAYQTLLKRAGQKNLARAAKVQLLTQPKKYADEDPQVLTDGAFGGTSFYANWLGFEGNDLEAVIDLGEIKEFSYVSIAFLQVTNHIVFFPEQVAFSISEDGTKYTPLETVSTQHPISPESKRNDIELFEVQNHPATARYIKIKAKNVAKAPAWHNAAGLPVWIFADEVTVN
ncbi:DUF4838 domain-containing protein [Maribellus sp. YY47]|uniref:DUF4838 domain-containing protein n=1 Tax=Maribellus sp. YY47 TaxID=2929486 RepID=UPI002000E2D8|nr:DUF4838 domain-containing protein [Maribellus sp. YY47]MCK3685836.1 DUF4838 domain-containing protein [Maribellus sp. YY47]